MVTVVVKPGEHLYQIAEREGFRDAATIWDDGGNAELRRKRKNPAVVNPGDSLIIPDKWPKKVDCATGKKHVFVAKGETLKLRLTLLDFDRKPVAGAAAVLIVEGARFDLVSDGAGVVEQAVPRSARNAHLTVDALALELPISIGELDPVDSDNGWRARLINLGYYRGSIGDDDEASSKRWAWAIEEFQCDHGIAVTGRADGATLAKLEEGHGS